LDCLTKVKRIVCEWLASLLGFVEKQKPHARYDDDVERNDQEDILDEGFANHVEPQLAQTTVLSDPVLIDIRDLLRKKARVDEEEHVRAKDMEKIKRDWMLAALVANRLCFVLFTTTLLAVTFIFFCVFHMQH